jgi:hypothetical protein
MMTVRRACAILIGVGAVVLAAAGPAQVLQPGQPAPSIAGGPWVNSAPLSIEGLRGRVVLVEFWTYG